MSQNGKNMTADEFSAWMKSRGVRVARGSNAQAPVAVPPAPASSVPGMPALPPVSPSSTPPAPVQPPASDVFPPNPN
jgi:hypothetical protein